MRRVHRRFHLIVVLAIAAMVIWLVLAGPRFAPPPTTPADAAADAIFSEAP